MTIDFLKIASAIDQDLLETVSKTDEQIIQDMLSDNPMFRDILSYAAHKSLPDPLTKQHLTQKYAYVDALGFPKIVFFEQSEKRQGMYQIKMIDSDGSEYTSQSMMSVHHLPELPKNLKTLCFIQKKDNHTLALNILNIEQVIPSSFSEEELDAMKEEKEKGYKALIKAVHQNTEFFKKFNCHQFGNITEDCNITKRNGFIYFSDSANNISVEIDVSKSKKSESEIISTLIFACKVNPRVFEGDSWAGLFTGMEHKRLSDPPVNIQGFQVLIKDQKDLSEIGPLKKNIYSLALNLLKKTEDPKNFIMFNYNLRKQSLIRYLELIKNQETISSFDRARLDLALSKLSSVILKNPNLFNLTNEQNILIKIHQDVLQKTVVVKQKEPEKIVSKKISSEQFVSHPPIDLPKILQKPVFQVQIGSTDFQSLERYKDLGVEGRYNVYNKGTGYIDFYNLKTIILQKMVTGCIDSNEIDTMVCSLAKLLTNYQDFGFKIPNQQAQFLTICLHHLRIQSLIHENVLPAQEGLKKTVLQASVQAINKSISCFIDDRYNAFLTPQERDICADLLAKYPPHPNEAFSYGRSTDCMKKAIEEAMNVERYDFKESLRPYVDKNHRNIGQFDKVSANEYFISKHKKSFYVHGHLSEALKKCITQFDLFCSVPQKKFSVEEVYRFPSKGSLSTHGRSDTTLTSGDGFGRNERLFNEDTLFSEIKSCDPLKQAAETGRQMLLYDALCLDLNEPSAGQENSAFLREVQQDIVERVDPSSLPLLRNFRVIADQSDGKVRFLAMVDYIKNNPAILENEVAKSSIMNALFYNKDVLDPSDENKKLRRLLSQELKTLKQRTRPGEYTPGAGFLNILIVLSEDKVDKALYEKEFFGEFLLFVKSLSVKKNEMISENKKNDVKVDHNIQDGLTVAQRNRLSSEYKNAVEMAVSGMMLAKNTQDDVLFLCCHEMFLRCRSQCTNEDDSLFHFNADLQKYFFERAFNVPIDKESAEKIQAVFGGLLSGVDFPTNIQKGANSEKVLLKTVANKSINLFLFTQQIEKDGLFQDINVDTRAIALQLTEPLKSYYLNALGSHSFLIKSENLTRDGDVFLMNIQGQEYKISKKIIENPDKSDKKRSFIPVWEAQTNIDGQDFSLFNLHKDYKEFDFILPSHIVEQYDCWISLDRQRIILSAKKAPVEKVYEYNVAEGVWKTSGGEKVISCLEHKSLLEIDRIFGPGIAVITSQGTYELLLKNSPDKKFIFTEKNQTVHYDNVQYLVNDKSLAIPFPHLLSTDGQHVLMANSDQVFHYNLTDKGLVSFEIPENLFHAFSCSDGCLYKDCLKALVDLKKNSTSYLEVTPKNEKSLLKIMADWDASVKKFENQTSIALFLKALAAFSVNKDIPKEMMVYINYYFKLYNTLENETAIIYQLTDCEYNVLNQHCRDLGFLPKQKEALHLKVDFDADNLKINILEHLIEPFVPQISEKLKAATPVSEEHETTPISVSEARKAGRTEDSRSFDLQKEAEEQAVQILFNKMNEDPTFIQQLIKKVRETKEQLNKLNLTDRPRKDDLQMFFKEMSQGQDMDSLTQDSIFSTEKMKKIRELFAENGIKFVSENAIEAVVLDHLLKSLNLLESTLLTGVSLNDDAQKQRFCRALIDLLKKDIQYDLSQEHAIASALKLELERDIHIRKEQNDIVDKIVAHYESELPDCSIGRHLAVRAPMGIGKTTFIFPLVMKRLSEKDPSVLNVAIVPKATYQMNKTTLTNVSGSLGQSVIPFEFSRYSKTGEWTLQEFQEKLENLRLAKNSRGYIITTKESLLSLKNKWRELLYSTTPVSAETRDKIKVLEEILLELKQSNFVADELDSLLDPKTELIYPISQKESFDEESIFDLLQLHQIMDFNFKSQLTPDEFLQKIIEFSNKNFPGHEKEIEDFFKYGTEFDDERLLKKMRIWKGVFEQRLPFTNSLNLLKDFGLSKENGDDYTAIPYKLGEPKEGSKFADPYLTAILTADLWCKEGISKEVFNKIFDDFKDKIKESQRTTPGNNLESLKYYKDFQDAFGLPFPFDPLAGTDNESGLRESLWKSVSKNKKFIHYALCKFILPTIGLNTVMVKSTSNDLMGMCRRFSGFTGTLYSKFLYNAKKTVQIKGYDSKIENVLLRKELNFVNFLSTETTIGQYFTDVFKEKNIDDYSVFLDIGGHFSDLKLTGDYRVSKNLRVAQGLCDFLGQSNNTTKRYIGYFDDNGALCFIDRNAENPKIFTPLTDTSIPITQYLGCDDNQFVIIYDQARCIGTDLKLPEKAKALGTVASHYGKKGELLSGTRWDALAQGIMRMRKFSKEGQQVDLICDQSLKDVGHVNNMQGLIDFSHANLEKTLIGDNETHALQVINSSAQDLVENFVKSSDTLEERVRREALAKTFLQEIQSQDPHALFKEKNSRQPIKDILNNYLKILAFNLQQLGIPDVKVNFYDPLLGYLSTYENLLLTEKPVSEDMKGSALGAVVECQQQAQQQAQQQQELVYQPDVIDPNLVPFVFKALPEPSLAEGDSFDNGYCIRSLNDLCSSSIFSERLMISCNLSQTAESDTVFSDRTKDAHFAIHLFNRDNQHIRTVLLTLREVEELKKNPKKGWGPYVITSVLDSKTVLASSDHKNLANALVPDDISEQMLVYSGAISELYELAKENKLKTLVNQPTYTKTVLVKFIEERSKKVYHCPLGKLGFLIEKIDPDRLTADPGLILTKDIPHEITREPIPVPPVPKPKPAPVVVPGPPGPVIVPGPPGPGPAPVPPAPAPKPEPITVEQTPFKSKEEIIASLNHYLGSPIHLVKLFLTAVFSVNIFGLGFRKALMARKLKKELEKMPTDTDLESKLKNYDDYNTYLESSKPLWLENFKPIHPENSAQNTDKPPTPTKSMFYKALHRTSE